MAATAIAPIHPATILPAPEVEVEDEVLEAAALVPEAVELPVAVAEPEAEEPVAVAEEEPVAVPLEEDELAPAEEPEEAVADDAPPVVTVARVVVVVAVPEEADEVPVEEAAAEEDEEDEEPSVMLNWFCIRLLSVHVHDHH